MNLAPMLPYAAGTLVVLVLTVIARKRDVTETFAVVTAAWLAWSGYIALRWLVGSPDYEPWYAGIVIDALAICALWHPPHKTRAAIIAVFILQIIIHMAYGGLKISHKPANGDVYADYLSITGWLELIIVGGWSGGHAWRRIDPFRRLVRSPRRPARRRDLGAP